MKLDVATTAYALHAMFPSNYSTPGGLVPCSGLAWEELTGEIATRITATLPYAQLDDGTWLSDLITLGTPITVLASMGESAVLQECARGIVEEVQPNDGTQGTFQILAYDTIRALLTNKVDIYYEPGATPLAIIQDLFGVQWNVPLGTLDASLGTIIFDNVPQLFRGETLADILLSLLQQAYDLGGPRLVPRSTAGKLEVLQAGTNSTVYWVVQGESVMRAVERVSTVDLITHIVVLGRGPTNAAAPIIAELESQATWTDAAGNVLTTQAVGMRQDMIHLSMRRTEKQIELAARKVLDTYGRPRHDRTIEAFDVPFVRKYDKIRVQAGTMGGPNESGYYSVESVTHDEPSGTMKLVLGNLLMPAVPGVFTMKDASAIPPDDSGAATDVSTSALVTDAERYQLAVAAGFTGQDAIIAVAVSIAEDGSGDPAALSKTRDLGLWQINEVHWAKYHGQEALIVPINNARAAYGVWTERGGPNGGWQAWTTYRNVAYANYMDRARVASTAPVSAVAATAVPNAAAGLVGSPNFGAGRPSGPPIAIVIHTEAGTEAGTVAWFQNPGSQVSAHYSVGLDGTSHQYVQLQDRAWANGIREAGNKWDKSGLPNVNPNDLTISIETEDMGSGATAVSDAQYNTVLALATAAKASYPTIAYLLHHSDISPSSRPNCPGTRWTAARFAALASALGLSTL